MSEEDAPSIEKKLIPLRIQGVELPSGVWPCPGDTLERHKEIENLSPVLLNAQSPLVLAIDAPWGGGKTTFIQLWRHYLEQSGQEKVSLYLNAWESDFSEDPLLPILSILDQWLSKDLEQSPSRQAWEKAKRFAPAILKGTAVAAAKAATFGALDIDKAYEEDLAEFTGNTVESLVDTYNLRLASFERFQVLLEASLDALPNHQQNLIIFVDELDRCKPTYSIMLLECIKHLFHIDRIVFVLAINSEQLCRSFEGAYGPSFDGKQYLKRFVDLDYRLQTPDLPKYIVSRFRLPDIEADMGSRRDGLHHLEAVTTTVKTLASRLSYQLRDIDQLATRFRLILRSIPKDHYIDAIPLICLLILRNEDQELYQKFIADPLCANQVIDLLTGVTPNSNEVPEYFGSLAGWIIQSGYDRYREVNLDSVVQPWEQRLDQLGESQGDLRYELDRLIRIARDSQAMNMRANLRELAHGRIELIHNIDVSI